MKPFAENINRTKWESGVKSRKWPVGARWHWWSQKVWAGEEADQIRLYGSQSVDPREKMDWRFTPKVKTDALPGESELQRKRRHVAAVLEAYGAQMDERGAIVFDRPPPKKGEKPPHSGVKRPNDPNHQKNQETAPRAPNGRK